jgi:FPC/CPF motif-containing protein YcgG
VIGAARAAVRPKAGTNSMWSPNPMKSSSSAGLPLAGSEQPSADREQPSLLMHPHEEPTGNWQRLAANFFHERMLGEDALFPCIFGVDAVRKGTLRYSFIPAGEQRVATLASALKEFTAIAPSLGIRTSLVCFFDFEPSVDSLEEYRQHFWGLLAELQAGDVSEWPTGISDDPQESTWEFSFNSTPLFVVANTPHHHQRRSRYAEYFTVTFQPRFVFDDLKAGTPTGDRARNVIRRRLREYDTIEQTPLLGSFGEAGNLEWTQYFLGDDNQPIDASRGCPMTHSRQSLTNSPNA